MTNHNGIPTPPTNLPWKGDKLPDLPESFPDHPMKQNVPPLPPRRRSTLDTGPVLPRPKHAGELRRPMGIVTSDKEE